MSSCDEFEKVRATLEWISKTTPLTRSDNTNETNILSADLGVVPCIGEHLISIKN